MRLREERKAALANSNNNQGGAGWGSNIDDDEEALGFFANVPTSKPPTFDEMGGGEANESINLEAGTSGGNKPKKTKKRKPTTGQVDEDLQGEGPKKKARAKKKPVTGVTE